MENFGGSDGIHPPFVGNAGGGDGVVGCRCRLWNRCCCQPFVGAVGRGSFFSADRCLLSRRVLVALGGSGFLRARSFCVAAVFGNRQGRGFLLVARRRSKARSERKLSRRVQACVPRGVPCVRIVVFLDSGRIALACFHACDVVELSLVAVDFSPCQQKRFVCNALGATQREKAAAFVRLCVAADEIECLVVDRLAVGVGFVAVRGIGGDRVESDAGRRDGFVCECAAAVLHRFAAVAVGGFSSEGGGSRRKGSPRRGADVAR